MAARAFAARGGALAHVGRSMKISAPTCRTPRAHRARRTSRPRVPRPCGARLRPAFICPRQRAGPLPTGNETGVAQCAGTRTRQSLCGARLQRAQRTGVRGARIRAGLRAPPFRSGILPPHALCRRVLARALFLALRLLRRHVLALAVRLSTRCSGTTATTTCSTGSIGPTTTISGARSARRAGVRAPRSPRPRTLPNGAAARRPA